MSSKHAQEVFNLSKRRYDNSIKELIDNGFLVDVNTDPDDVVNKWEFYEKPLVSESNKVLYQNDIRLNSQEDKPSPIDDTRNIIDNNINTRRINSFDKFIF